MADRIEITFPGVKSWKRPKTNSKGDFYSPHRIDLSDHKIIAKGKCNSLRHKCDGGGTWRVEVCIFPKDRRKRDIDRVASFYLDALEGSVYANDNQVEALSVMVVLNEHEKDGAVMVKCRRMRL